MAALRAAGAYYSLSCYCEIVFFFIKSMILRFLTVVGRLFLVSLPFESGRIFLVCAEDGRRGFLMGSCITTLEIIVYSEKYCPQKNPTVLGIRS